MKLSPPRPFGVIASHFKKDDAFSGMVTLNRYDPDTPATAIIHSATGVRKVLLSLCCIFLTLCVSRASIIFSFEEGESWRPSFNNAAVSDAEARDGLWSLGVKPGSSVYSSPSMMDDGDYTAISLSTMTSATPGSGKTYARFRVLIGNETAGLANPTTTLEFYLYRYSATNYQVLYREYTGTTLEQKTLDLGSAFDPTLWNDLSITLSEDRKSYALGVNDVRITGIGLTSNATGNDVITRVQFYNVANTDFSGTVYYDRIASIPEPSVLSSLLLIGGVVFGWQRIRRRTGLAKQESSELP